MRKKIIPDPVLMVMTILVIIGFQVYWLKDNYDREKRALQIKTNAAFQETVRQLQTATLKLPYPFSDDSTHKGKTRVFLNKDITQTNIDDGSLPRRQVITMVNNLRNRINDSVKTDTTLKSTMIFTIGSDSHAITRDSMSLGFRKLVDSNDHIFNVLYKVDSLQDSIKLPELTRRFSAVLKKQDLNVPFKITRSIGAKAQDEQNPSKVIVGFAHPVTYQLSLSNTSNYLLKKISLPILFSLKMRAVE